MFSVQSLQMESAVSGFRERIERMFDYHNPLNPLYWNGFYGGNPFHSLPGMAADQ